MARSVSTDFLHAFRYHVSATTAGLVGNVFLPSASVSNGKAQAGFTTVGTPSGSLDPAMYREGHYIYTRKQPGIPTMEDVQMSRGVALADTDFYFWFRVCVEGAGEYRVDLTIDHFHRDPAMPGRPGGAHPPPNTIQPQFLDLSSTRKKSYILYEAFSVGHKPSTDLDGSASDIAIQDVTVAYERFDIVDENTLSTTTTGTTTL